MRVAGIALGLLLMVGATTADARLFGGHHGGGGGGAGFGGHHGHPINAWMGNHRPRLR